MPLLCHHSIMQPAAVVRFTARTLTLPYMERRCAHVTRCIRRPENINDNHKIPNRTVVMAVLGGVAVIRWP